MNTPLQVIEKLGLPTDSYIAAIGVAKDPDNPLVLTKSEHEAAVAEIVGLDIVPVFEDDKHARHYFHYTIQETIRAYMIAAGGIPDMDEVWTEIQRRFAKFKHEQPWAFKDYVDEQRTDEYGEVKLDSVGKPKQKKGAKKQQAYALYQKLNGTTDRPGIIAAFMKDIGMTKAGATTYFHNCKKEFGFQEVKS
jgi:hypothetical protein